MKVERREEFEKWYNERLTSGELFDYFQELTTYCSQDVRILREAAMKFRKVMVSIGKVDPYERCLTLAHLCSIVFSQAISSS